MDLEQLFWGASVQELQKGYAELPGGEGYACVVCGEMAEKGRVFPVEDRWYDAEAYMKLHICQAHRSMFHYLLSLDKKWTGLTEVQSDVLQSAYGGLSDADTAKSLGSKPATIRYHRFHLREKEKQAKVFLALMGLLADKPEQESETFMPIHRTATMVDERYAVTSEENEKVLRTFFPSGLEGAMREIPAKEKRKIIVLKHILGRFERGRRYKEKEVNEILKTAHADFVTLRRYMIEYGFMAREDDCSAYWVKEEKSGSHESK